MSLLDVDKITLDVAGDVLTLTLGETSRKVKLPRGERGAPGRDGISIKGDTGEKGEIGRDGRDSVVPGEKGEKGDRGEQGRIGLTPDFSIGQVISGDVPSVILGGTPEKPLLNFVLPRGERGFAGLPGKAGKDGSHEFVNLLFMGHSPRFCNQFLATHVICDGVVDLPEMTEADVGAWTHIKTLTDVVVNGLLEQQCKLAKDSKKFIVVPYNGKFVFTAF
jgi:hypothetical protein